MHGSIHQDKHGYRVHFQGRWFRRVKLNGHWVSFKDRYDLAEDFLVLVNGDLLRGKYDSRDWTSDEPLAFHALAQQWLDMRENKVRSFRVIRNHVAKASNFFGTKNVRTIRFVDLQRFYNCLPGQMAPKTKRNVLTTLRSFFAWVVDREADSPYPIVMPKFPKVENYQPTMRKILSPEDQAKVLAELRETVPYKLYLGALCITYGLRWEELRQVKMKDLNNGRMTIYDWKQRHYKTKQLLTEDWEAVKSERGFGNEFFFRHPSGRQYGKDYLYEKIRQAAKSLGFDVIAYAIIRHSTITALSDYYTPEEIKEGFSLHLSDSVWRYLHLKEEKKREMYARARGKIVAKPLLRGQERQK